MKLLRIKGYIKQMRLFISFRANIVIFNSVVHQTRDIGPSLRKFLKRTFYKVIKIYQDIYNLGRIYYCQPT